MKSLSKPDRARRRAVLRRAATIVVATCLAVTGLGQPVQAKPVAKPFTRLTVQKEHVVPGTSGTTTPSAADPAARHALRTAPAAPSWPTPGSVTVDLPSTPTGAAAAAGVVASPLAAGVRVGTMPVRVARHQTDPADRSGAHPLTAASPTRVRVETLDRASADRVGPGTVLMRIGRADGGTGAAPVDLSIDSAGFAKAYGGDYANRLQLVSVPECALTGARSPSCAPRPLASRQAGTVVSAAVPAAAGTSGGTLVALATSPSGSTGTFAATTLAASGSWAAGGSSGDFSWSYGMRVPPALGGPAPQLALAYSSQSVDGRHAASNNQPSWAGQGFELWSGYVERSYKGCLDDMGGGANNTVKTADECWGTDNATMSLGGKTVELIRDDATGEWHPKSDDASRVEHLTGATNGDNDGEYWKVTTADGTQYFFGRNRLPGWVSGKPETNSTWTVPVFGNNTGEPCHQATFDASYCTQAWRWNLDYVVDPHGNSMSYRYATETNKYGRDLDSTKVSSYIRGGYLTEIDYGTRTEAEFGNAPQRVLFTAADRCLPGTVCDSAHPASWPDVPWDQNCTATTCTQNAPSFWTQKRLASVKTQVWGGTAYRDVEQWTLTHTFPDPADGTQAGLWLSKISHSGLVGGTATVPDVTFTGVQMHNRVDTIDGSPAMNWWRVASIKTETGGEISVTYSPEDCVAGSRMPTAPESNTMRCYPVIWTPLGYTDPITDWFQKYVVTAVSETDHTGGAPRVLTSYTYKGDAAWHYTDDDGLVPPKQKTWSQWRGYQIVGVTKGDPGEQSYGETRYFRGMDGDHLPSGTRSATVTDSRGGTFTDSDAYAGTAREAITDNGPGGAEVSSVLTDPWQSAPTATRTQNGVTTQARYVREGVRSHRIALDGGRGFRYMTTTTTYDGYGMATQVDDQGDVNDPNDDQCTINTYVRNTGSWLMSTLSRTQQYGLRCGTSVSSAGQIIADTRTSYDGLGWGVAPTKGDVTRVEGVKDWSGGTTTYLTTTRGQYDGNGRVTSTWDAADHQTTTAYTPASGAPVTKTAVTNVLGYVTSTDLEPAWGLTTGVTDPNGRRTDVGYDALGRTTSVWLPGHAKGVQPADSTYSYLIRTDGPAVVTTNKLGPNGVYITTYALFDGLLRPRQTQASAVGSAGGSIVTDTLYDSAGRTFKSNAAYVTASAPGTTLFTASGDNQIPAQTRTLFDGADRPTASILMSLGVEKWRTSTAYGGDHTVVTPPAGGTATDTVTDGRDRTVSLRRYHGATPSGTYDAIGYTFTAAGKLATVTDPAGNVWRYGYDARNRQTGVTDPDRGTRSVTYDDLGNILTTTDGRGQTVATSYDALSRKTAEYDGSTSGTKLADWTYDTLNGQLTAKGQQTSATRWVNNNAYVTATTGFDARYHPTGTKITIPASEGALAGSYQYNYTYKPDGSLSTTTIPAAGGLAQETVANTYTDLGQLATLGGLSSYVTQADYTRFGEPAVLTFSTGGLLAQTGLEYDEPTRRINRIEAVRETNPAWIADAHYTWNAAGDITGIADTPTGGTSDSQCFSYDGLRRLTTAWTPANGDCVSTPTVGALGGPAPYWQSFSYDVVGNRLSSVDHNAAGDTTVTNSYPTGGGGTRPHALTSATTSGPGGTSTAAYGYDNGGNTTSRPGTSGTQTLSWDAGGHLSTVADSSGSSNYVYDVSGGRLTGHDSSGSTLYLPGMEVHASVTTQVSAIRYYSFGAVTVAQRDSNGVTWLMGDHQGTAEVSVSAASQAVIQRRQKPFGEARGTAMAWPNPRGFVGGTDDPGGLVHLGAREYDSAAGRFISTDPVFDGTNPAQMLGYGYAGNSPVTASDPTGLYVATQDGDDDRTKGAPTKPTGDKERPPPPPPYNGDLVQKDPCESFCPNFLGTNDLRYSGPLNLFIGFIADQNNREFKFDDNYLMTQRLAGTQAMETIMAKVSKTVKNCKDLMDSACSGGGDHSVEGGFRKDALKVAANVMASPMGFGPDLTATYLGSYRYDWKVVGFAKSGKPVVEMQVTNWTTWESFLRNPLTGYGPNYHKDNAWWIDRLPQYHQAQTFTFHEIASD